MNNIRQNCLEIESRTDDKQGKTLYVCRANMGRSQVAAGLHNFYAPGQAESAGTQVDEIEAEYVEEWDGSSVVISAMRERGIDISHNRRRQIDKDQASRYGRVVIMAELNTRPLYLLGFDNATIWDIPDLKDKNIEEANVIIDDIDSRVRRIVIDQAS